MSINHDVRAGRPNVGALALVLVFLHLFVAPCATAMVLMSADADCEHCQAVDGSGACIVASEASTSVIGNAAFDAGRANPPVPSGLLGRADHPGLLPGASAADFRSGALATRHSGDPPLYLLLGQLRL
jgi:hypothetical protein